MFCFFFKKKIKEEEEEEADFIFLFSLNFIQKARGGEKTMWIEFQNSNNSPAKY